jgi:hypothetical protein
MANSTTLYKGQDGRTWVDVTLNKTLVAADCGIVQNVIATGVTVTVPATVVGYIYIVRNGGKVITSGGPAGAVGDGNTVTVAPTGTDGFTGNAFTAATSKGAVNTTGNIGDELKIVGSGVNSAAAWIIDNSKGTWTRQP